jgi:predicted RNA binding protein YcfA (HicA-like mRNA interferase family)
MSEFPSMKAARLLRLLMSEPLNYRIKRQTGSHRTLVSNSHPQLLFSYHETLELRPFEVRGVLVKQVRLSVTQALELLQ